MRRLRVLLASCTMLVGISACNGPRVPPRPETWAETPTPTHSPRPIPKGSYEGAERSLLDEYGSRTPRELDEIETWRLPTNAKTIVVELLIAAAKDDPRRALEFLGVDAGWGAPHRGQLRRRPIVTPDDPLGVDFLTALRSASSRLGEKAAFSCTPLQPNWGLLADSGAEPMWCSYHSKDGLDLLVFRLVKQQGKLQIDYVGLFAERQTELTFTKDAGLPPPITPYTKVPVSLAPYEPDKAKSSEPEPSEPEPSEPAPSEPAPSEPEADAPEQPIAVTPPEDNGEDAPDDAGDEEPIPVTPG